MKACLAFQCQCTKSHKLLSSALFQQCMFRMCHIGMTKQQQATKSIAIANTQKSRFTTNDDVDDGGNDGSDDGSVFLNKLRAPRPCHGVCDWLGSVYHPAVF